MRSTSGFYGVSLIYSDALSFQAFESEAVMSNFRSANEKLSRAFDGFPGEELEISDELKEKAGKEAKGYTRHRTGNGYDSCIFQR